MDGLARYLMMIFCFAIFYGTVRWISEVDSAVGRLCMQIGGKPVKSGWANNAKCELPTTKE